MISQGTQRLLDEPRLEPVVPGGDRSVRREHRSRRGDLPDVLEGLSVALHERSGELECRETAVALVQMDDSRPDTHRVQGAHPAHAENELLPDADLPVAAVELRGQLAVHVGVLLDVRVEQNEPAPPDARGPDLNVDVVAAGRFQNDAEGLPLSVRRLEGQTLDIRVEVMFLLPAVRSRDSG